MGGPDRGAPAPPPRLVEDGGGDARPGAPAGLDLRRDPGGRHRHLGGRRHERDRRLGGAGPGDALPRRADHRLARHDGPRRGGERRGRALAGAHDSGGAGVPRRPRGSQPAAGRRVRGGGPRRGRPRDRPAVNGLRLAVSLLTVIPLPAPRVDRGTARQAMILAPAVGLVVGGAAALVLVLGEWLGLAPFLRAALAVAVMAVITRALHLDGLADLADGLGSGRPAQDALAIMKRSDIGPFGVVTLLLTLLIQVAALASTPDAPVAVLIAAVTGRLALPWACRTGVPSARPDGLGALVSGTITTGIALAVTGFCLLAAFGAGLAIGRPVHAAAAVLAGVGTALLLLRHSTRRLGGVTGDVFGAVVETATTAALIVLAVRP
ncbi:adenosylcobinamide-GDP ribazoletransferase [Actinomadura rudentiformis]|uniref:Adenosylcobinamide-GDP ribazoletransferase n=1 Tax=Actinomadura rudentiformis TaxID=359158 RepID=A0A6H9YGA3_9ACTN|nr:adenosylcobinamide-GDP ribazoletransferase [Actinomadura rudentiformis]